MCLVATMHYFDFLDRKSKLVSNEYWWEFKQ